MALPLGKFTILVGAGVLGSVLAQEGHVSKVSDFFSGAFKIVFKHIQQHESPSIGKPQNGVLLAQVNSLRQELQLLASSSSVTIMTTSRSGATAYGVPVVVIGIVGYGYIRWKGWKLSDMMFATRRSLSDASTTVAKQLEQVDASLSEAKKHLSSRIQTVDKNLDECKKFTEETRDEVALLREDLSGVGVDIQSVHSAVQTLDLTNEGVYRLCEFAQNLNRGTDTEHMQTLPSSSSRPALDLPKVGPASMTVTLPATVLALEPPSPSSANQTLKFSRPSQTATLASGLKELQGISEMIKVSNSEASNGTPITEEPNSGQPSGSGQSQWKLPRMNAALLARTHSFTYALR